MLCGSRSRSYIKAQYKETLSNKLPKIECTDTAGDELPVTGGIIGQAELPVNTIGSILATMAG